MVSVYLPLLTPIGRQNVCFSCDRARILWCENLTLYLLLSTTCLSLLDTGSPYPQPNSRASHTRLCLASPRPKSQLWCLIINNSNGPVQQGSFLFLSLALKSRSWTLMVRGWQQPSADVKNRFEKGCQSLVPLAKCKDPLNYLNAELLRWSLINICLSHAAILKRKFSLIKKKKGVEFMC